MRSEETDDSKAAAFPVLWVLGLAVLAWLNRFIQDDAFISFQYARNFAAGNGLTFNPGEAVEGYTNFLWTVLMAVGFRLGVEPILWSQVLGVLIFAGTLALTFRLTEGLTRSSRAAFLAMLLLGTNYTFSAYATGGLETQLQAFLVVAAVWASWRGTRDGIHPVWLAAASAAYGLALLTRLDSVVALIVPGLLTVLLIVRAETGGGAKAAGLLALALPGTALVAPWLVWKVSFYGDVLPNTFYVKVSSAASLVRGGHYVYRFFATYWLLPLVVLALLVKGRDIDEALRRRGAPWGPGLVLAVTVWCGYVASVGGDFMEFRFMVPVLPFIMLLLGWCLVAVVADRRLQSAIGIIVMLGSFFHATTFWGVRDIESVRSLEIHMEPDGGDWDEVGVTLGTHFDRDSGVSIAVGPAGAIPFYADLDTIDMRGLIDPWVARNGIIVSTVPGHQRMSPLSYLIEREVSLVIGHPQVVSQAEPLPDAFALSSLSQFGLVDATADNVPNDARMLAIPMSGDRWLLTLYLTPHPAIEQAIASDGWPAVPLNDTVRPF